MKYAVMRDSGECEYFGKSLADAEGIARATCLKSPSHLMVLKESYETITKTSVQVIKQEGHNERHGK